MLTSTPDLAHADLVRLLSYNPKTGMFTWREPSSKRIRPGDEAGAFTHNGYYRLTLLGKSYYGHHLAWFYMHEKWPLNADPLFRNGDHSDCSADNFTFTRRSYSDAPAAIAARQTRRKKTAAADLKGRDKGSPIDEIRWSDAVQKWQINLPRTSDTEPRRIIGETRTFKQATELFFTRSAAIAYVDAHPPQPVTEADMQLFAGDAEAVNFVEVNGWLCYNPDNGHFYKRMRHTRASDNKHQPTIGSHILAAGERADHLNTNGAPVISFFGRDYPASMMAIFMTTKTWPRRRAVVFADGNKTNLARANLSAREQS